MIFILCVKMNPKNQVEKFSMATTLTSPSSNKSLSFLQYTSDFRSEMIKYNFKGSIIISNCLIWWWFSFFIHFGSEKCYHAEGVRFGFINTYEISSYFQFKINNEFQISFQIVWKMRKIVRYLIKCKPKELTSNHECTRRANSCNSLQKKKSN